MRRNGRIKNKGSKAISDKIIMYSIMGVAILTVILVGLMIYSKNLSDDVKEGTITLEQMANIAGNNTANETTNGTNITKNNTTTNSVDSKNKVTTNNTNTEAKTTTKTVNSQATEKKEEKRELNFAKPVDGEVSRDYAKDNLIYSETLKEWVTHLGIDIKADKTTVVKAAEAGTVKSIKNDPRYGLTIVIDHGDGMQTVYANLLTSEFVVEGEKVEKGQSIGTVGNTAVFEIADEPHLHFEILKDSIQVDPNIYLK